MTKEEAYQLLEQVTGLLQGTRADHQKILEALSVLKPNDDNKRTS